MMDLIRWNPLREAFSLQEQMNRLIGGTLPGGEDARQGLWNPAVDIFEEDDKLIVKAELPGVEKKDISVDLQNGVLTLKGERRHESEEKDGRNVCRREMSYGRFVRSFSIPDEVQAEKVKAEYVNGVLTIEVPKPEARQPKQIKVN
jgi:HSP20 family protein